MDSSTEESDSRYVALSKKRKQPEHHGSDSSEKQLKRDRVTVSPSFDRTQSKDSNTTVESHHVANSQPASRFGWTPINGDTYDPFVNPLQHDSGLADAESAGDATLGISDRTESGPEPASDHVDGMAVDTSDEKHHTILEKLQNHNHLSSDEYVAMARWLDQNDSALKFTDMAQAGLRTKVAGLLNADKWDRPNNVAKALELLSYGEALFWPARKFLKDRYWLMMQAKLGRGHSSPPGARSVPDSAYVDGTTRPNEANCSNAILRRVQNDEAISIGEHIAMAQWLEHNDPALSLHDIPHRGLMASVQSMILTDRLDDTGGSIAKVLGKLAYGRDYSNQARVFIKDRYLAVQLPKTGAESGIGVEIPAKIEESPISRSERLRSSRRIPEEEDVVTPDVPNGSESPDEDMLVEGRIREIIAKGSTVPRNLCHYVAKWLHDHNAGPELQDISDDKLRKKIKKKLDSKKRDKNDSVPFLLAQAIQKKKKGEKRNENSEKARAYLTAWYTAAQKSGNSNQPQTDRGEALVKLCTQGASALDIDELATLVPEPTRTRRTSPNLSKSKNVGVLQNLWRNPNDPLNPVVARQLVLLIRARKPPPDGYFHLCRYLEALHLGYSYSDVTAHAAKTQQYDSQDEPMHDPSNPALSEPLSDEVLELERAIQGGTTAFSRPMEVRDLGTNFQFVAMVRAMAQDMNTRLEEVLLTLAKDSKHSDAARFFLKQYTKNFHKVASSPAPPPSAPPQHSFDYGEMARKAAVGPIDLTQDDGGSYMSGPLDEYERSGRPQSYSTGLEAFQRRYFHVTDQASFRCLCCGKDGHGEDSCPSLTCDQCGAVDDHFSGACPANQKCGRCRQRGHLTSDCTVLSSSIMRGFNDKCDICNRLNHVEEECPELWRSSLGDDEIVNLVPSIVMHVSCYNCGASDRFGQPSHWGDDCPKLSRYEGTSLNDTYSKKHADKFVQGELKQYRHAASIEGKVFGSGSGSIPSYQLAMLGGY